MIAAYVIMGAAVIIGIILIIENYDGFFLAVMGVIISALVGILAVMVFNLLSFIAPTKIVPDDPVYLYGLRNSSEISGSFFLGIGSIDETQTAFYSIKEADGGIVFRDMPLEEIRIYEDDPAKPYLQSYHGEFAAKWAEYVFVIPVYSGDKPTEFHIPTGSVFQGYSIK